MRPLPQRGQITVPPQTWEPLVQLIISPFWCELCDQEFEYIFLLLTGGCKCILKLSYPRHIHQMIKNNNINFTWNIFNHSSLHILSLILSFSIISLSQKTSMENKALEPDSVGISMEDNIICNGGNQQQEASMLKQKKVENHLKEAQRFTHLPKRSPVDLEFIDISYTIQEGSCCRSRGNAH